MTAADPTIEVVQAAISFATAAVHGDGDLAQELARDALVLDADGFLGALATTIQAIADDADEAGGDTAAHLRELGLGIHLAAGYEDARRPSGTQPPQDP